MTLRAYLIAMMLATVICWTVFAFIIFSINPFATNWIGFSLFYLSLFLSLVGTSALVGFLIRFVWLHKVLAFHSVSEAFRQSFLFSALIVIGLLLLSKNMFTWLNALLLAAGLSVLEFFLISYKKS